MRKCKESEEDAMAFRLKEAGLGLHKKHQNLAPCKGERAGKQSRRRRVCHQQAWQCFLKKGQYLVIVAFF